MSNEQEEMKIVVGYYDWRDTICEKCREKYNIDVSTFTVLTLAGALEDDGYLCDYCGKEFPKLDSTRKAAQV